MAFDPITAITGLVNKGLDKFVADKMSETDRERLKNDMTLFTMAEARAAESDFRDFVLSYEGSADNVPKFVIILRSLIRPCFTILVGWMDYLFFTGSTATWDPEAIAMLKAINIIVLAFWFGERALKNSGLLEMLLSRKK